MSNAVHGPVGPARAILVAVPARDEADHIAACLRSLDRAAARTGLPVTIVVAADACHDDTVEIARTAAVSRCRVDVIDGRWYAAGGARRAAVEAGLARIGGDLSTVWIANTDGDCVTPATWLQRQLRYAARGTAAVAGTVALDPDTTSDHLLAEFAAAYPVHGDAHRHVHGANLGCAPTSTAPSGAGAPTPSSARTTPSGGGCVPPGSTSCSRPTSPS